MAVVITLIELDLSRVWPPVIPADPARVTALAEHLRRGGEVPAVRVVEGVAPGLFRITDGNHRVAAALLAGRTHLAAQVRTHLPNQR